MNARLAKETRDLAPVLLGTVLLVAAIYCIWGNRLGPIGFFVFALGCGIMAAGSFGNEFRNRTISLLLSQPVPRRLIWREKMLVLAGGLTAMVAVLAVCQRIYDRPSLEVVPLLVVPLCAFCGTPCLTLASGSGIVGLVAGWGVPCPGHAGRRAGQPLCAP